MNISDVQFVVLDFETVTPKGRPPEPIELAAMRINPGLKIDSQFKFNHLIRPPEGAPITSFDTAQTGIRWSDVEDAPSASEVLSQFEHLFGSSPCILVAQNARYEASVILRYSVACPSVAKMVFIDTVMLGKYVIPSLTNYKLDTLADYLHIRIPAGRHRALPDVELTVQIFIKLLNLGREKGMVTIDSLKKVACISPQQAEEFIQGSLFG